jgi:hypothetical protein
MSSFVEGFNCGMARPMMPPRTDGSSATGRIRVYLLTLIFHHEGRYAV